MGTVVLLLSVDFTEDEIEGADDGDDVGDEGANGHFFEGGEIEKTGGADAQAPGLKGSVGDDVVAEFALGGLDGGIDFAGGGLEDFWDLGEDGAGGDTIEGLADDAEALAHFFNADEVAVVAVGVLAGRDVEIELVVGGVGLGLAEVPGEAGGAEDGAGDGVGLAVGGGEDADAFEAVDPDGILGEEAFVFVEAGGEGGAKGEEFGLEGVMEFVLEAADAEGVGGEAGAAVVLEDLEDIFTLAHGVEEGGHGAEVEGGCAEPEQVGGDAVEFGEDDADELGARGRLDADEFFDSEAIAEAIGDGGDVIHAIDVGGELGVGAVFADFFDAAVEVADDAFDRLDAFAIELEDEAEDTVGRGVLRPHVEDHFRGFEMVSHCPLLMPRWFCTQDWSMARMLFSLRRGKPCQSSGRRMRLRLGWPAKEMPNMS